MSFMGSGWSVRLTQASAADGTREIRSGRNVPATKVATCRRAVGAFTRSATHPWVMRSATLDELPPAHAERSGQEHERHEEAHERQCLLPAAPRVEQANRLDDALVRC